MENFKIILECKDNVLKTNMENPVHILDILEATFSFQLNAMNTFINQISEEDREAVKEDLYDKYNAAASNVLELFGPEFELRPDLTTQAILKAENEIIETEYEKLKSE